MPPDLAAAPVTTPKPATPRAGGAAAEPPARKAKRADPKPKRQPTGDYEVGNCRPPEHGKIKKGEVRNKRGRPKGARGLNTVIRSLMEEKITLRVPRGEKKMSRVEALILKTIESGFSGNSRAALGALTMYAKAAPEAPPEDKPIAADAEQDDAIIEAFKAMLLIGEAATEEEDGGASDEQSDAHSGAEGSDHE